MFRQQVERSGCSSAEPYPLACEDLFCDSQKARQASLLGELIVDLEVLSYEPHAAVKSVGCFLRRKSL